MGDDEQRSPRDRAADEAAWQDLVSRLGDLGRDTDGSGEEPPDGNPGSPGDEEPGDSTGHGADPGVGPAAGDSGPVESGATTGTGPRDYGLSEESEEEWVPEDPPALGSGNPLSVVAWVCAAGAPLALLLVAILWRSAPAVVWVGLCVVFLAAAGFLAFRLPSERNDGDDGARV